MIFVKRSRTDKETAFLLGWEKMDFFDVARPAFEKCGFGLIKPLGADKDALYLPQIEGETLREFIRKIPERRGRQEIKARFLEDSLVLEGEIMDAVRDLLKQKGYRIEEDNSQDFHRFINPEGDEVRDLNVLIDVYPGLLKKDNPHRYKNAMVLPGVYKKITQLLKDKDFDGAYEVLKKAIIFIDPFYIGVPKH